MSHEEPKGTAVESRERVLQKMRTRRDLVGAATALLHRGVVPTMPEVAREANVSRGTVYRFFPSQHALLAEVLRSVAVNPEDVRALLEQTPDDAEQRLRLTCAAVYAALAKNEGAFRTFLRYSLEAGDVSPADRRVKGRFAWIDVALEPVASRLAPARLATLRVQVAALLGIEPFIVFRDVCGLSAEAAAAMAAGTAVALLRVALREQDESAAG